MKSSAIATVLIACALTACGKSESSDTAATSDSTPSSEKADEAKASGVSSSKVDSETPADKFAVMDTAVSCLGIYANIAPADGKERAVAAFAGIQDSGFRKLDGFARADKIKATEAAFDEAAAPFKGKTLFTYTSQKTDNYRQYDMERKAFFDSTGLTWGSHNEITGESTGNNSLSFNNNSGYCVLQLINTDNWQSQFKVEDEAQARAADEARRNGNGHVKYYLQAVNANKADSGNDWPRVQAEIVRVELVDASGKLLARAHPTL